MNIYIYTMNNLIQWCSSLDLAQLPLWSFIEPSTHSLKVFCLFVCYCFLWVFCFALFCFYSVQKLRINFLIVAEVNILKEQSLMWASRLSEAKRYGLGLVYTVLWVFLGISNESWTRRRRREFFKKRKCFSPKCTLNWVFRTA